MVTVYYEDGSTFVQYAEGKRPLKFDVYLIDSPESDAYLDTIIDFVIATANKPEHIAKMEPAKYWALIERLGTMFCRAYSPTKNHGVTKAKIRSVVYFVLDNAIKAGRWPTAYVITDKTAVQFGGDYVQSEPD
ncbi:hypothetical protein [Paenibacillus ehimensis]|uniref:Uncharacterized protein n=1 Tax=Paenibacillus ehimensis TaxID=79264 RepID=A0ABT8VMF3_9BACL|nr:hypothetical protein [Paenibacillus ehimensis]MDO3682163.1 hypothetical protein [Paenibacillus ehimensis]